MDAGDVTGDGEPKAGGTRILIARMVEAVEGPEHVLALSFRDAGTVVLDFDDKRAVLTARAHLHMVGEAHRVVDEIGSPRA